MSSKASEIIQSLQDLVAKYGDLDVWVSIDDEGNGYNQLWMPEIGYIDKYEADNYRQDDILIDIDDLKERCMEDLEETDDDYEDGREPTEQELEEYLAENYVRVIVH